MGKGEGKRRLAQAQGTGGVGKGWHKATGQAAKEQGRHKAVRHQAYKATGCYSWKAATRLRLQPEPTHPSHSR